MQNAEVMEERRDVLSVCRHRHLYENAAKLISHRMAAGKIIRPTYIIVVTFRK